MGKEIVIDQAVRDGFIHNGEFKTPMGLLIGAYTEKGDYNVAWMAATQSESQGDEDVTLKDPTTGDILSADPSDLSHHAKQVIRMLPGGLFVLGFYVTDPVDNIFTAKYETALKHLVTALNKGLTRNPYYSAEFVPTSERLIFHFNSQSKKFVCRAIEPSTFKTRNLETSFSKLSWAKLECEYDTVAAMHLAKLDCGVPLKKNLLVLMKTFQETLDKARFLVEGRLPTKDIVYLERRPRSPSTDEPSILELEEDEDLPERPLSPLHILVDKVPGLLRWDMNGSQSDDFVNHLHMTGKIAAVAFVPEGSSTLTMVTNLRLDILRSMASRIEMHCESLIGEESTGTDAGDNVEFDAKVYHEVPRRVFVLVPGSNKLLVSDYLFPGEGPQDSLGSFRDLLSIQLNDEEDIIVHREKPFGDTEERNSKGSMEELLSKAESMTKLKQTGARKFVIVLALLSIFVLVAAVTIPMFPGVLNSFKKTK